VELSSTHKNNGMNKIRTILMGTPEFAEKIFRKFYSAMWDKFEILAVITALDKPAGRKQELIPSPVKKWALRLNLPILQPKKIADPAEIRRVQELNPELIILCAYGQIIPKEILEMLSSRQGRGKYGALNIHPSLLPKYRGASPIQATILNGDKIAGATIMLMDEKMDHGDIISNFQFPISNKPTYEELSEKLADLGAELLIKTLPDWISGKTKPRPQDHSKATFCKIIKKQDGKIDWNKSAEQIERQIRAFHKWPGSFAEIKSQKSKVKNKILKILNADVVNKNTENKPGKIFLDKNKNLCVQTGNGILILKQVQLEGKKPMSCSSFLNGHPEILTSCLQ